MGVRKWGRGSNDTGERNLFSVMSGTHFIINKLLLGFDKLSFRQQTHLKKNLMKVGSRWL